MMAFILKLRKLEVRLIKKTLMAQAMLDQANFSLMQSQEMLTQEQKDMEKLLSTFTENIGSQQDQNFLQDDNVVPKKKRRKDYSNTKLKTRNLLKNVSYRRFKKSDFKKSCFIIDILSFLVQNLIVKEKKRR